MKQARVISLAEWPLHKKAEVAHVHTQDRRALQKIIAMGVLPKTQITLLQKFPSYVFEVQNTRFSIDKELASSIYLQEVVPL